MTTPQHLKVEPVPVHIVNFHEQLAGRGADNKHRKHVQSVFRTIMLTAANPVWPLLAEDRSREAAWIIAYGNSAVLCSSQSQAEDPANQIAGTGFLANSPANPQGTMLYVPSGAFFTTPTNPQSVRWTLNTTEQVWVTALAFPTLIAFTTENRAAGY